MEYGNIFNFRWVILVYVILPTTKEGIAKLSDLHFIRLLESPFESVDETNEYPDLSLSFCVWQWT